jgi:hypothetical protein
VADAERLTVRIVDDLADVPVGDWNALADGNPFLRHEFFNALHETGCASTRTGWSPRFVTVWAGQLLRAASRRSMCSFHPRPKRASSRRRGSCSAAACSSTGPMPGTRASTSSSAR